MNIMITRKHFQLLLLAVLMMAPVGATVTEAVPQGKRAARAENWVTEAKRLTGVVKGVTETRLFIETEPGVEQTIRIDSRTTIARQTAPQVGDVVEVELDRADIIKSALMIKTATTQVAKK
jgi:hypothetical protein